MESNRYQNGKVYKIVDNGYNKFYIGSTIEALSVRLAKHRSGYRNYLNGGKASCKAGATVTDAGCAISSCGGTSSGADA